MTTEVYPYQNIGENIPLKKGKSFTELTNALARQLSSFITGTERVQADFSADNALGPVLDSIGKLVDVTRRTGQSDSILSNIILNEVSTREQSTIDALTTAINNVIGIDPTISEYPDVDFINDHGLSKNEGAFLLTITMPDQERLKDVKLQTDLYKAAGMAVIYNILSELTFTDEMTIFEELLSITLTYSHTEELLTLSDNLDGFEIGLIETLTSITEQLDIEAAFIEGTSLTMDDYLSLEAILDLSDDLTTITDYFGGGSIDAISFTESLPNRPIARIGSAIIGTSVIGGGWWYGDLSEWDHGEWDMAEWDNDTDKLLKIKELF